MISADDVKANVKQHNKSFIVVFIVVFASDK